MHRDQWARRRVRGSARDQLLRSRELGALSLARNIARTLDDGRGGGGGGGNALTPEQAVAAIARFMARRRREPGH